VQPFFTVRPSTCLTCIREMGVQNKRERARWGHGYLPGWVYEGQLFIVAEDLRDRAVSRYRNCTAQCSAVQLDQILWSYRSALEPRSECLGQRGDDLMQIADHAEASQFENGRIGILVDGDDRFGCAHSR